MKDKGGRRYEVRLFVGVFRRKIGIMRNPFNLQKNDAEFVEASQNTRAREIQIMRLSIARSWTLVSTLLLTAFLLLMLALDPTKFIQHNLFWLFFYPINLASFAHLDSQIKFLKVLSSEMTSGE